MRSDDLINRSPMMFRATGYSVNRYDDHLKIGWSYRFFYCPVINLSLTD